MKPTVCLHHAGIPVRLPANRQVQSYYLYFMFPSRSGVSVINIPFLKNPTLIGTD